MASGKITLSTPKSTVEGYIKWSSEAGPAAGNYSLVSASIYLRKTDGYTSWGTFSGSLKIAGKSYSFSKYASLGSSYVLITSEKNIKVTHDSDGTKSITIGTSFKIPDTTIAGTYSASKSVKLDTIKRLSYCTGPFDITAGENFTLHITRYASSYVHDVTIKSGSTVIREVTGCGEQVTFSAQVFHENVFEALGGSLSGDCTIEVVTRSGSAQLGSYTYDGTINAQSPGLLTVSKSSCYIGETQGVALFGLCSLYDYAASLQFADQQEQSLTLSESGTAAFTVGDDFAQQMPPDANRAECVLTVEASYAGIPVGEPLSTSFGVILPESYRAIDFAETAASCTFLNDDITGSSQIFINRAGTAQMEIPQSAAAQAYGRGYITAYQLKMGEQAVTAAGGGTGDIVLELTGGTGQVMELSIYDSRGNSRTCVYNISSENFIDYSPLNLKVCSIYRENGFDKTVKLYVEGTGWCGNFGLAENAVSFSYKVRKSGESQAETQEAITGIPIGADGTFSGTYTLSAGDWKEFDIDSTYTIEGTVADGVLGIEKTAAIQSAIIGMYLKRNQDQYHVGINCRPDEEEMYAENQKAGLSVQGDFTLIGQTAAEASMYTDSAGDLNLSGGLNVSGNVMQGSLFLPVVTKKGQNYIELDLGTHKLAMNWGKVLAEVTEVNKPVATSVSFQEGLFEEAPIITLTPRSGVIGTVVKGVAFNSETADGFDLYVNRSNSTNFYVHWNAILITAK